MSSAKFYISIKSFKSLVILHILICFLHEGSCLPLGTFEKKAFGIINKLAKLINQLLSFNNIGSFVYAHLILSMKAAI